MTIFAKTVTSIVSLTRGPLGLTRIASLTLVQVQNFGGWQAVSLGGGVTVMKKRDILLGWVTKVCLNVQKSWGREGG